ncbi:solute carrier family 13 member 2-like [Haemaphysalis longicornis]
MQVGAFVFLLSFLLATDTFPAPVTALFPLLLLPAQGLASAQHVSSLYMRDDQVVFLTVMFTLVTLAECGVYNRCAFYALKSVRGSIPALMAIVMGIAVAMALVSGDVDSSLVLLPMAGVLADEVYLDYIESEPMQSRNLDSGVITPVPAPQQLQGGGAEPDQGAPGGGAIASSSVPEPGENIAPLPEGAQTQQRPSNCAHATFASVLGKPRRSVSFKKRVLMHKDHRDRALFLEEKNVFQQSMAMAIVCGATLGVSASIVGPSPSKKLNLYLERKYGADSTVGLLNWIFYSVPSTAVSCVIAWWYLSYNKIPARIMDPETKLASCIFERRWALLGPAGFAECAAVAILIALMFSGYLFRYGVLGLHKDSRVNQVVVSLALAALLFLVPAEPTLTDKSPPLVSWTTLCRKTPWACLFLLGCANVVIQQIQNTRIDSFVVALLGGGLRSAAPTSVLLLSIVASLQAELTPYGRDYDTLFEAVDQEVRAWFVFSPLPA